MSNVNYNQMSNKTPKAPIDNTPQTPVSPAAPTTPEVVTGVVDNCGKLNVRKQPSIKSDVVVVIDKGAEVVIDETKSTEEFYRVRSASEANPFYGFCMKKYITVNQ